MLPQYRLRLTPKKRKLLSRPHLKPPRKRKRLKGYKRKLKVKPPRRTKKPPSWQRKPARNRMKWSFN